MNKFLLFFGTFFCVATSCMGQTKKYPVRISFDIPRMPNEEIYVAYYFLDKVYIKDSLKLSDKGKAVFNDSLERGVFIVYSPTKQKYLSEFMVDKEHTFTMKIDVWQDQYSSTFTGSPMNAAMVEFKNFIKMYSLRTDSINELGLPTSETAPLLETINKKLKDKREETIRTQQNLFGKTLKLSLLPEYKAAYNAKDSAASFNAYRKAFIDRIDFSDYAICYSPIFSSQITTYLDDLTVQDPDSQNVACDYLLQKSIVNDNMYKSMLITLLNKYARGNYAHNEVTYVHLAKNYYAKGKAPWIVAQELENILKNAERLEYSMMGKKAFDFEIPDQFGIPTKLSSIPGKGFVLLFFDPTCKRCTDALRALAEMEKVYAAQGITFISVQIAKFSDGDPKNLYTTLGQTNMKNLILADGPSMEDVLYKYNLQSYPQLFILDKNKKIYMKKFNVEQTAQLLDLYINE